MRGDGWQGHSALAPYDAIHVGAAAVRAGRGVLWACARSGCCAKSSFAARLPPLSPCSHASGRSANFLTAWDRCLQRCLQSSRKKRILGLVANTGCAGDGAGAGAGADRGLSPANPIRLSATTNGK